MAITCTGVLEGFVLWLILFNFLINGLTGRTERTHIINCKGGSLALWRAEAEYEMILINWKMV